MSSQAKPGSYFLSVGTKACHSHRHDLAMDMCGSDLKCQRLRPILLRSLMSILSEFCKLSLALVPTLFTSLNDDELTKRFYKPVFLACTQDSQASHFSGRLSTADGG